MEIRIEGLDWGLRIGIGDWGFGIKDWDWGMGIEIGNWDWNLALGIVNGNRDWILGRGYCLNTQKCTGPNLNTQNYTGPNVMCAWELTKSKSPLNKIPARVTLLVVKLGHKALIRAMIDIFQFLLINTLPTYYSLNISEITNVSIT